MTTKPSRRASAPKKPKTKPAAKPVEKPDAVPQKHVEPPPMPTENGTAFLVDPSRTTEALSEYEAEKMRRLLKLMRNDQELPLKEAVNWMLSAGTDAPGKDDKGVLGHLLYHYGNESGCHGVLGGFIGPIEDVDGREFEVLQWTLQAIRAGGWFAEWLALQVDAIANASHPDDRNPSPLKIASTLALCVEEHEEQMEAAREMVRMRPDLLFPTPAAAAAPEPPAASETTTRPTNKPAKAQRARKTRKKAVHA